MNAEKWVSLHAAREVEFAKAVYEDLKDGARLYLQAHCAKVLQDSDV